MRAAAAAASRRPQSACGRYPRSTIPACPSGAFSDDELVLDDAAATLHRRVHQYMHGEDEIFLDDDAASLHRVASARAADVIGCDDSTEGRPGPPAPLVRPQSSAGLLRERQVEWSRASDERHDRSDRELLHRHLYHMGEANRWAEQLGLHARFCAHRREDGGGVCCHVFEDGTFAKELSLDLFDRRYQALRSRHRQQKLTPPPARRPSPSIEQRRQGSAAKARPAPSPVAAGLTDSAQAARQLEVREATAELRQIQAALLAQREVLRTVDPPLRPFAAVPC